MAKKRVFVSFDYDNDKGLKDLFVGQARKPDSPFEVIDHSLKESQPESDWEEKAKAAISRSQLFIVMLGSRTRWASGVLKEVRMANELSKDRAQIIGRRHGNESWRIRGAGRVYKWNWQNLKKLLG